MKKYIDADIYSIIIGERSNGKLVVEKELMKKANIIKDLKWTLSKMYDSVVKALYDTDTKADDKEYLRGCQDCIATIKWIIYKGEHYEN